MELRVLIYLFALENTAIIRNIHITIQDEPDKILWSLTPNGQFSTKSVYKFLTNRQLGLKPNEGPDLTFMWMWKMKTLPKIKQFFWLVSLNRISSKVNLKHRNILQDDICARCLSEKETTLHLLRDCIHSVNYWCTAFQDIKYNPPDFFQETNLFLWSKRNCSDSSPP